MPVFDLEQDYENEERPEKGNNFKYYAARDIHTTFFNGNEHADPHNVDGKDVLVVIEESDARKHAAHWEAGAKQNFDSGLYNLNIELFIKVDDYGPKPKQGKVLKLDNLKYLVKQCYDEGGIYKMTLERIRQS